MEPKPRPEPPFRPRVPSHRKKAARKSSWRRRQEPAPRPAANRDLVRRGIAIANQIALANGRVTSVEVFKAMRDEGLGPRLEAADPRWAGRLFSGANWTRVGYEPTGSHGRPVAIWSLKGETQST